MDTEVDKGISAVKKSVGYTEISSPIPDADNQYGDTAMTLAEV